jgi:ferredoxin--NADP+ reductase
MSIDATTSRKELRPGEPLLRAAKMHLVTPDAPVYGTVVENRRCTASMKAAGFVRHVAIDVSGTPLAGSFIAGQSFGVLAPGLDANGKPHKLRLYSIASPTSGEDGRGSVLATTVKRTIDEHWDTGKLFLGVCSNYLCDLAIGNKVSVTGPNGKRFVLPQEPPLHDYLFIATGTGIAPFRGMVLELLHARVPSRVTLVMGSPYATDLLYHDEFQRLAAEHANFTYLTSISREKQPDGSPPMYVHDHLARSRDALTPLLESPRTLIYICGIAGMELGVVQQVARQLAPAAREQYVEADAAAMADIASWTRPMLHKQVKPTRRVFMEVY